MASRREIAATPVAKPALVDVADFDLDASQIASEQPHVLPAPPRIPARLARRLVDSMSDPIVAALGEQGVAAR